MRDITEEFDHEIDRLIASGVTPSELACKGVQSMISGAVDAAMLNHGHTCQCDPHLTYSYGEQLFIRAMDELKTRK